MCLITPVSAKVSSSYSHMRGPGICCWYSDHSNCSHWSFKATMLPINPNIYNDQCEHVVIYHYIYLLVVIHLCSPSCWHLCSNYCRTRCRQSQLRVVLSSQLLHLHSRLTNVSVASWWRGMDTDINSTVKFRPKVTRERESMSVRPTQKVINTSITWVVVATNRLSCTRGKTLCCKTKWVSDLIKYLWASVHTRLLILHSIDWHLCFKSNTSDILGNVRKNALPWSLFPQNTRFGNHARYLF